MVAFSNKKEKNGVSNKRFLLKFGGILVLIVAMLLIFADYRIYQERIKLSNEVASYEKQIQAIEKKNANLKEEIANSDNPDYIEKVAREQEDMQKPGETVVSFVLPAQTPEKSNSNPENFWSASVWFGWLGQSWNWIKTKL